jgi:replicative DNA helicase
MNLGSAKDKWRSRADKLHVHDSGMATVTNIRAEAARLERTGNLGLIVVDYLQLMQGSGEENRNQEVAAISRGLKQLARKLNIPILALSQMNRSIEHRSEKRPVLADLRESGALEQDADVVMFLHSDASYDPDIEPDGTVEVIVAKQRQGETGVVKLAFNRAFSSFKTLGGGKQ